MNADFTPSLQPYNKTGGFRFWCQKVLPLVYDDSLSYYELLCKVADFLNNLIQNTDGLYEDIKELQQAYQQLQDYVNNYFDNLDVQEEINNKLDSLVNDGTIASILTKINRTVVDITSLGIKNDGSDISYELNNLLKNSNIIPYFPDGKYLLENIDCSNTIELIFSKNALVYGKDFTPMFVFNNNEYVHIKGGIFNHGETTYPTQGAESYYNSVFLFNNCKNININDVSFAYLYGGNGIRCSTCENIYINNVSAFNFIGSAIGLSNGCKNIYINNCYFENGIKINNYMYSYGIATGVSSFTDDLPSYVDNLTINNCVFKNMSWEGCDSHGGNNITFKNLKFYNCARFFTCYYDDRPINNQKFAMSFSNWVFENIECVNDDDFVVDDTRKISISSGINVFGSTSHHINNVIFKNCLFKNLFISESNSVGVSHEGIIGLKYSNVIYDGIIGVENTLNNFLRIISCYNTDIESLETKNIYTLYATIQVMQSIANIHNSIITNKNSITTWCSSVSDRTYRLTYNNVITNANSDIPARYNRLLYLYGDEYGLYNNDKGLTISSNGLRNDTDNSVTISGNSQGNINANDNESWIMFDDSSSDNISTRNFALGQFVNITYGSTTILTAIIDFVGYGIKVNNYI